MGFNVSQRATPSTHLKQTAPSMSAPETSNMPEPAATRLPAAAAEAITAKEGDHNAPAPAAPRNAAQDACDLARAAELLAEGKKALDADPEAAAAALQEALQLRERAGQVCMGMCACGGRGMCAWAGEHGQVNIGRKVEVSMRCTRCRVSRAMHLPTCQHVVTSLPLFS